MKTFRSSRNGPFQQQVFYKPQEVETICTNALRSAGLYPTDIEPIRIDRFIEKKFGITLSYEDLPSDLYGFTIFGNNGVQSVTVAKSFDDEGTKSAERKLRTTIAHEAGHGLLHTHLFCMHEEKTKPMFADYADPNKPKILCRDANPEKTSYDGRWWEYQANMTIGALLLPRPLVVSALNNLLEALGSLGLKTLPKENKEAAIKLCSEIFNVNPAVAKIRIDEIWPALKSNQMQL